MQWTDWATACMLASDCQRGSCSSTNNCFHSTQSGTLLSAALNSTFSGRTGWQNSWGKTKHTQLFKLVSSQGWEAQRVEEISNRQGQQYFWNNKQERPISSCTSLNLHIFTLLKMSIGKGHFQISIVRKSAGKDFDRWQRVILLSSWLTVQSYAHLLKSKLHWV